MASNRVEPDSKSASVRSLEEVETLKTKEVITLKYSASSLQVFFMGISIIVGGQFMGWNKALTMGLWECMIGLVIVSIGYFCLTFCLAEMASILPFAVILSSLFILLTTCGIGPLGPFDLAGQAHFAGYGYVEGLNLKSRPLWDGFFALPACIGTAYGYIYAFGQQLHSLAQSGLAPSFLKRCCGAYDAPYAAVIAGSIKPYLGCV
eukprot:scaffold1290_cov248-Ochromonas_danica.AAC.17